MPGRFVIAGATLAFAAGVAASANAQGASTSNTGWYFSVSGQTQNRGTAREITGAAATQFSQGYGIAGAVGYRFHDWRIDLEDSYQNNADKSEEVKGFFAKQNADGNIGITSYTINAAHDFNLKSKHGGVSKFKPYASVGIGTYQSRINGLTSATLLSPPPGTISPTVVDTASAWTGCWQVRLGANYTIDNRTEAFIGWRHFKGDSHLRFNTPTLGTLRPNGPDMNALELGVRVNI